MQKHKTDPVGQHDQDDLYEGHVLVMEKSYPAIGKGIGNRIGTKWVHRHLHGNDSYYPYYDSYYHYYDSYDSADLNKRKLSINHPDESHKSTHYFMAPGNNREDNLHIIMRHCYHYDSLINKLEKILEKSKPAENQNPIDRRFTFDVGVNEGKETKLLTFQVYHETRLDKNIHINPRLKTNTNTRNGRRNLGRVRPEIIEISTGNSHPEWPRSIWASMIIL